MPQSQSKRTHEGYEECCIAELGTHVNSSKLLLVTATKIETEILHGYLKPLEGYRTLIKVYEGNQTYFVGILGEYLAVHVQCDAGAVGHTSSSITITDAIGHWSPRAILMPGIAFGIDEKSQNIGDVLVSEAVVPYDNKRVGKDGIVPRNPIPVAGTVLLNRFKNSQDFGYQLKDGSTPKVSFCQLLSGETLVDNLEYRDQLIRTYPAVKGGEMEGAGVFAASHSKGLEWLIVKGICDFADGNKHLNKTEYQITAATTAIELCLHVFLSQSAFEAIGLVPFIKKKVYIDVNKKLNNMKLINDVLFSWYTDNVEKYYLSREIDREINGILNCFGIWISGPCGSGKTIAALRNLQVNKRNYIFMSLSQANFSNGSDIFKDIFFELKDIVMETIGVKYDSPDDNRYLAKITEIFINHYSDELIFICMDEVPIGCEEHAEKFLNNIVALQGSIANSSPKSDVRIVVSTIRNPKDFIRDFQVKVKEKIRFLEISYWSQDEIRSLLNILQESLSINFNGDEEKIIEASCGSPRFVKTFIRSYISFKDDEKWTIDRHLRSTFEELAI